MKKNKPRDQNAMKPEPFFARFLKRGDGTKTGVRAGVRVASMQKDVDILF